MLLAAAYILSLLWLHLSTLGEMSLDEVRAMELAYS